MKKIYMIALCCIFYTHANAQNLQDETVVDTYEKSLDKKEDFWSKVKHTFKSKEKKEAIQRSSEPVLVKNDPDRTIRKVPRKNPKATVTSKEESHDAPTAEADASKKKTLSSAWSKLVNGKDYVAPKKYHQVKKNTEKEDDYMAMGKAKKAERAQSTQKGSAVKLKPAPLTPEQKNIQKLAARQSAQYYASLNKKSAAKNTVKETVTVPKQELPVQEPEVVDHTIRNEIKPLSLVRAVNGAASYFVTGIATGKFYVVTNLASKGSVVKVTNPNNGKSLLAEVLDPLPAGDSKKGLILKLSDNAKMPLGQNNNSFTVKVNY